MEIIYKKTDEVRPYENNPRLNDAAVKPVAESIKEFGFKVPIIITSDNVIVTGHTRLKAAEMLGLEEVPCIVADDLTDKQIQAFRLADNKTAEFADWDFDKLMEELDSLDSMDLFGFATLESDELFLDDDEIDVSRYSQNVKIPQYEITGKMPTVDELLKTEKAEELIEEIEATPMDDETKMFLKMAAYRHVVFNYKNIAEFYAHQTAEVQRLMEKSALVIIDLDDAIANGYVKLSKTIQDLLEDDDE